ncbi:hypothetical protein [Comamonas sp.]|uniref:hypothetical protein n=1 Tax=Comamonas sp. TaxID=34028 RepID=UPI0026498E05|nr:hypothetical protein [Comamonas sp.]MDN5539868.1 hypothetical protein [Comamonas sp.]
MDKFYKIAAEYFNTFEGRHLYPKPWSWVWLWWSIALGYASWTYWHVAIQNAPYGSYWMLSSIIFLGFANKSIQEQKFQKLKGLVAPNGELLSAHVREINRLTGKHQREFLELTEELLTLMDLQRNHGPRTFKLSTLVSALTLKGQRWVTALTVLSIGAGMLASAKPNALPMFIQLLSNEGFLHAASIMLFVACIVLVTLTMATYMLRTLWQGALRWWARMHPKKLGQAVHIAYLLHHLIKLHDPTESAVHKRIWTKPSLKARRDGKRLKRTAL